MGMSIWHLLILLLIILLFMGPGRVEKLGPSLGRALRGFKKGLSGEDEANESADEVAAQTRELKEKLEMLEKKAASKKTADVKKPGNGSET
jgi:TatA/E family protein of Tat protein translocase